MKIDKTKIEILLARKGETYESFERRLWGKPNGSMSRVMSRCSCRPKTAGQIAKGFGVDVTEIIKQEEK